MRKLMRYSAANVALVFVGVSMVALALFAGVLWFAWSHTIGAGREAALTDDAARLEAVYRRDGMAGLRSALEIEVGMRYGRRQNVIMLLADDTHRPLAGNLPAWPAEVGEVDAIQHAVVELGGRPTGVILLARPLAGGYRLLVGRNVQRFDTLQRTFLFGLLNAGSIVSLVGIGGALMMRHSVLSQVQHISQATHAIVQGDLSHRLADPAGADELHELVATVNRMLDQIETLVEGVRNVSNSIAHDLRTPLSELRSRLEELAVTRPAPEQAYAEIDGAIADVDRVIGIFNALLRMAEIDTGVRRAGFVDVDAADVAAEAAEFYQPVAELKGLTLTCAVNGPLPLRGDPLLLAQAMGNLIDNAIKYSPEHAGIHVGAARAHDGAIELVVADTGHGIPDAEKPRVLERFYRCDASRGTPGVGLGLSLVATVAKLHGGALILNDNRPGLRAALMLPGDPAPGG